MQNAGQKPQNLDSVLIMVQEKTELNKRSKSFWSMNFLFCLFGSLQNTMYVAEDSILTKIPQVSSKITFHGSVGTH